MWVKVWVCFCVCPCVFALLCLLYVARTSITSEQCSRNNSIAELILPTDVNTPNKERTQRELKGCLTFSISLQSCVFFGY